MTESEKLPVLAVVGPTASGKTALGVMLAKQYHGEVISADLSRAGYCHCETNAGRTGRRTASSDRLYSDRCRIQRCRLSVSG